MERMIVAFLESLANNAVIQLVIVAVIMDTIFGACRAVKQRKFNSCVGIDGAWHGDHIGWQIPYGALLPQNIENLITAGRSISAEPLMSDVVRVIPNCWVSGHAAGVAAALAVKESTLARNVPIAKLQSLLREQNAYLG